MSARFSPAQRVAAVSVPVLAKHIAAGTTGQILERSGWRYYVVMFDGDTAPVTLAPEQLVRVAADAAPVPAPPRFRLRGRFVNSN